MCLVTYNAFFAVFCAFGKPTFYASLPNDLSRRCKICINLFGWLNRHGVNMLVAGEICFKSQVRGFHTSGRREVQQYRLQCCLVLRTSVFIQKHWWVFV